MNVLLLTDGIYPYTTGGMQKHSYYLAKYLLQKGHSLTLIHCVTPETILNKHLFGEENTNRLREFTLPFPEGINFPGHYMVKSYRYSKHVYALIKDTLHDHDYIYIQGFSGWYLLKKHIDRPLKAVTILNFHGLEMFQLNVGLKARLQAGVLRFFAKKNLRNANFVHSLGGKLTSILQNNVGIDTNKIIEAPIGIEKKWIRDGQLSVNPVRQLAFIGRNEPRKGFPDLVKALGTLDPSSKYHLHIIGPFEHESNQNFTFHGLIRSEDDIIKILDTCDVLICPSHAEGMPTVILEAMSRGNVIVASNVGAVQYEVDEQNGWLFEAGNQQQLVECLNKVLLASPEELIQKKTHSIEKIKSFFLWDNLIERMFRTP